MKMLYVGPLWEGSTALQRLQGFQVLPQVEVVPLDSQDRVGQASFADRLRHRLRWPADRHRLNVAVLAAVREQRYEVVFIDGVRVITSLTLRALKSQGMRLAYYTPDDIVAPHNSSRQLEESYSLWDLFFTTKTFNVSELRERGVRRPVLVGNAFDPQVHRPMSSVEVGPTYERFDAVFVGTYEDARMRSINHMGQSGISVVIYGNDWPHKRLDPSVHLGPPAYGLQYARALHEGRVTLCFLRKINRDRVTTRSVEIPAAARPMLAEKTDEHDEMFVDGAEYVSFRTDEELVMRARELLSDSQRRSLIAAAGQARCLSSGYSTVDRAREMMNHILSMFQSSSLP